MLEFGRVSRGECDTGLSRLQVLGKGAVSHSTMGIKQITLVIIGLHDGIDDLVVVITIGVNVTAKVLVRAHDLYHTAGKGSRKSP